MFERFTDRARRVVVLAQEEARLLKHNYIGTEHLLLGLMREEEGLAAQTLQALGLSHDAAARRVSEIVGHGEGAQSEGARSEGAQSGHIPFTARAKKVLELSLREALQLSHDYIGTEHILLGLVEEGQGVAVEVMADLGVDPAQVRSEVIRALPEVRSAIENVGLAKARRLSTPGQADQVAQLAQLRARVVEVEGRLAAVEAEAAGLRALLREHGINPGAAGGAGAAGGSGAAGGTGTAGGPSEAG